MKETNEFLYSGQSWTRNQTNAVVHRTCKNLALLIFIYRNSLSFNGDRPPYYTLELILVCKTLLQAGCGGCLGFLLSSLLISGCKFIHSIYHIISPTLNECRMHIYFLRATVNAQGSIGRKFSACINT